MKLENIGKIYKIRIGHDDNGQSIGWHLARVSYIHIFGIYLLLIIIKVN